MGSQTSEEATFAAPGLSNVHEPEAVVVERVDPALLPEIDRALLLRPDASTRQTAATLPINRVAEPEQTVVLDQVGPCGEFLFGRLQNP